MPNPSGDVYAPPSARVYEYNHDESFVRYDSSVPDTDEVYAPPAPRIIKDGPFMQIPTDSVEGPKEISLF